MKTKTYLAGIAVGALFATQAAAEMPGEFSANRQCNRDGRVDVRTADATHRVDRQGNGKPPDTRHLPAALQRIKGNGDMDGAASEENQYECPDTLGQGTGSEFLMIAHTVKIPEIAKRRNSPSPTGNKKKTWRDTVGSLAPAK